MKAEPSPFSNSEENNIIATKNSENDGIDLESSQMNILNEDVRKKK
jgi:hypothetical protein